MAGSLRKKRPFWTALKDWFFRIRFWITIVCLFILGAAFGFYWWMGDARPEWSRQVVEDYAPWKHPETRLIWSAWGGGEVGPDQVAMAMREVQSSTVPGMKERYEQERRRLLHRYREMAQETEDALAEARRTGNRTGSEIAGAEATLERIRKGVHYLESLPEKAAEATGLRPEQGPGAAP
ncbi:MAG: hypothetical protein KIT79_01110 [Deltaproteobacteria bacterium]|nr:hypothetical protein [Deltaproteobacteria bacterium]